MNRCLALIQMLMHVLIIHLNVWMTMYRPTESPPLPNFINFYSYAWLWSRKSQSHSNLHFSQEVWSAQTLLTSHAGGPVGDWLETSGAGERLRDSPACTRSPKLLLVFLCSPKLLLMERRNAKFYPFRKPSTQHHFHLGKPSESL